MARFFVNRPIVAMVMSIVLVLVGFVVMQGLPIAQFPEIVPPMINVTTTYVGASAVDNMRASNFRASISSDNQIRNLRVRLTPDCVLRSHNM